MYRSKEFFASVSCIQKGLNPLETKLAVVADTKRQGSVVLAATPKLKRNWYQNRVKTIRDSAS